MIKKLVIIVSAVICAGFVINKVDHHTFMCGMRVYAEEANSQTDGDYTYTVDADGNATITAWSGNDEELIVPAVLGEGNYQVTAIGEKVFSGNKTFNEVVLPEGILTIGKYAFRNCSKLTTVTIPTSLTSAGEEFSQPFSGDSLLKTVHWGEGIERIPDYILSNSGIEEIIIPDTVTEIGNKAFYSCKKLQTVQIGSGVQAIGDKAFETTALTAVNIPEGVVTIGKNAFASCTGLTTVTIPASLTSAGEEFSQPFSGDDAIKTVYWGAQIKKIPNYIFSNSGIEEITIPDTVDEIGTKAFYNCTKLNIVHIGTSVRTIGYRAFDSTALKEIDLPEGIIIIGNRAFSSCAELTTVTIPASLTNAEYAFVGDVALLDIHWGEGIEKITKGLFYNCGIKTVNIPDTVKEIQAYAFADCENLQTINLGKNLETIGDRAFENDGKIENIQFQSGVTSIGANAFSNNVGLKEVALPNGILTLGTGAFRNCTALKKVTIPATLTSATFCFAGDKVLETINWGEGIEIIPQSMFYNCGIKTVNIPNSVKEIQAYAFSNCENLKTINLSENLDTIGASAFENDMKIEEIALPDSVKSIGDKTFGGCSNMSSVTLPDSLNTNSSFPKIFDGEPDQITFYSRINNRVRLLGLLNGINVEPLNNYRLSDDQLENYGNTYSLKEYDDYLEHVINFQRKEPGEGQVIICLPEGVKLYDDKIYLNGKEVQNAVICDNQIAVSVDDSAGMISLYTNKDKGEGKPTYAVYSSERYGSLFLSDNIKYLNKDSMNLINVVKLPDERLRLALNYDKKTGIITAYGSAAVDSRVRLTNESTKKSEELTVNKCGNFVKEMDSSGLAEGEYWIFSLEYADDDKYYKKVYESVSRESLSSIVVEEFTVHYKNHNEVCAVDLLSKKKKNIYYLPGTDFVFVVRVKDNSRIKNIYVIGIEDEEFEMLECRYDKGNNIYYAVGQFNNIIPNKMALTFKTDYEADYYKKDVDPAQVAAAMDVLSPNWEDTIEETEEGLKYEFYPEGKEVQDNKITSTIRKADLTQIDSEEKLYSYFENMGYDINNDVYLSIVGDAEKAYYSITAENDKGLRQILITKPTEDIGTEETLTSFLSAEDDYIEPQELSSYEVTVNHGDPNFANMVRDAADVIKSCITDEDASAVERTLDEDVNAYFDVTYEAADLFEKGSDNYGGDVWNIGTDWIIKNTFDNAVSSAKDSMKPDWLKSWEDIKSNLNHIIEGGKELLSKNGDYYEPGVVEKADDIFDIDYEKVVKNKKEEDKKKKEEELREEEERRRREEEKWKKKKDEKYPPDPWEPYEDPVSVVEDPSGFVYEAVNTNYVEDATAQIYYRKDADSEAVLWDAEPYEQINPQVTDATGIFHWDVPRGEYQVRITKEGYEDAATEWLPVPPPQIGIEIPIISKAEPKVDDITADSEGIRIVFDKYLIEQTISDGSCTVKDSDGNVIDGLACRATDVEEQDGTSFSRTIEIMGDLTSYKGKELSVAFADTVKSYADVSVSKSAVSVKVDGVADETEPKGSEESKKPEEKTPSQSETEQKSQLDPGSDNTTTTQQQDNTNDKSNTIANVNIGQNLVDTKAKVSVKVISNTLDNPTAAYVRSTDKNAGKKTSLSVPDTVTIEGVKYKIVEVSSSAFKNKKKLKKVTIGKNVTTIGDNAFAGCSKLKKIIIKSTVLKSVGKNAIKGINKKASIKVPKKQLKAYKKLFTKKTGYKKTMKVKK